MYDNAMSAERAHMGLGFFLLYRRLHFFSLLLYFDFDGISSSSSSSSSSTCLLQMIIVKDDEETRLVARPHHYRLLRSSRSLTIILADWVSILGSAAPTS